MIKIFLFIIGLWLMIYGAYHSAILLAMVGTALVCYNVPFKIKKS